MEAQGWPDQRPFFQEGWDRRTARGLARLFEFEEFEQEFEDYFENESRHAPTLRVAADLIAARIPPSLMIGYLCISLSVGLANQ